LIGFIWGRKQLSQLIRNVQLGKLGARIILWDINEEMNIETRKMLDDLGVEVGKKAKITILTANLYFFPVKSLQSGFERLETNLRSGRRSETGHGRSGYFGEQCWDCKRKEIV
jgi:hypothetical protein